MRSIAQKFGTAVSAYTLIIFIGGSTCLKIVGVNVPAVADLRQPARLSCSYNTGQSAIFSVKWYKDDQEFYRFMPKHKPSVMKFQQNGFVVRQEDDASADCFKSKCNIVLDEMTPAASGTYTCEVSTEAPAFKTYIDTKNMTVAALPAGEPVLEGFRGAYMVGETFDVTCKTSASLPPARMNLYINNEEVDEKNVSRLVMPVENELFVSMARLKITLTKKHFNGGLVLKLKCLATLTSVPSSARSVTGTATLGDSQPLRNQKLEWPNSASGVNSRSKILMLSILCIRWIMFNSWADFSPS